MQDEGGRDAPSIAVAIRVSGVPIANPPHFAGYVLETTRDWRRWIIEPIADAVHLGLDLVELGCDQVVRHRLHYTSRPRPARDARVFGLSWAARCAGLLTTRRELYSEGGRIASVED